MASYKDCRISSSILILMKYMVKEILIVFAKEGDPIVPNICCTDVYRKLHKHPYINDISYKESEN